MVIIERRISGLARRSRFGLDWPMPSSRGRGAGPGGLDGVSAVERLAAQPLGDAGSFADRGPGGLVIAEVAEVLGVVAQTVSQVVGVECSRSPATAAANAAAPGPRPLAVRRARAMSRSARSKGASCPGW